MPEGMIVLADRAVRRWKKKSAQYGWVCALMADQRYHRHSKGLADARRSAAAFSLENANSMGVRVR